MVGSDKGRSGDDRGVRPPVRRIRARNVQPYRHDVRGSVFGDRGVWGVGTLPGWQVGGPGPRKEMTKKQRKTMCSFLRVLPNALTIVLLMWILVILLQHTS